MSKISTLIVCCLVCGLLLPPAAVAAAAGNPATDELSNRLPPGFEAELDRVTEPGAVPRPPNWWWKLGELILALVIIVALIVVVAHLLRRTVGRSGVSSGGGMGPMRSLGVFHFDQRHSVQLLEVGKSVLVLGLAEGSVVLLDKIEDEGTITELQKAGPEAETVRHFGEQLKNAFSRVKRSEDLELSKKAVQKLKDGLKDKTKR